MKKYNEIKFPKTRIATFDVSELGRKKHHIKGLLELDVTRARQLIREDRIKTNKQLSFTAWLIKTISTTLAEYQQAYAYLHNKRKAISFIDIDVAMTVEREYDGMLVPLPYVVRQANSKDWYEITQEISEAKTKPLTKEDIVLDHARNSFSTNLYYAMPGFIRRSIWQHFLLSPKIAKKNMGNVMFSSIGMMGNVSGWFIPMSVHPVCFGIGAVTRKPGVIGKNIEIRDYLHLTVLLDHDVIDGAPMARFIAKLAKNIESGFGFSE